MWNIYIDLQQLAVHLIVFILQIVIAKIICFIWHTIYTLRKLIIYYHNFVRTKRQYKLYKVTNQNIVLI